MLSRRSSPRSPSRTVSTAGDQLSHTELLTSTGGSLATTPKSKKGATPKKRSKTGEDGEDNGDGDGDSPTKKPRKTPTKKSKVKSEETGDEDAAEGASPGEDVAETPAKKPRKTPVKKAAKVKDVVDEDAADAAEAGA